MPTEVAEIPKLEAKLLGVFRTSNGPCKIGKPLDAEPTETAEDDEAMVHVAQVSVKNPQNSLLSVDRISYIVNNTNEITVTSPIPSEVNANDAVMLELPLPENVKPATGFGSNFQAADLKIAIAMFVRLLDSEDVRKIDLVV